MSHADAPPVGPARYPSGTPTVERLNELFATRLEAARVVSVREEPIGTGQMSESRRLHLTYSGPSSMPSTLIAKFPSGDERSRAAGRATRCYEVESSFYRDLHGALDVGAPTCFHVERNEETDDFLLLLEDLAPCRQGDQLEGCSPDEAGACVDELVKLHGPLWNSPFLGRLGWLNRSTSRERSGSRALLQSVYPSFVERYHDRLEPSTYRLVERFVHDPGSYFHRELPHRTVVHGDFRLDNLLFRNGGVGVVDFQTVTHACGVQDLAYFLGAGLSVDDRRVHERDLVRRWVDGLSGYGVSIAVDAAWDEYRAFAFAGVVMSVVASMLVQRTPRGDEMFLAMAHRHAQHAIDLDSLDAVQN